MLKFINFLEFLIGVQRVTCRHGETIKVVMLPFYPRRPDSFSPFSSPTAREFSPIQAYRTRPLGRRHQRSTRRHPGYRHRLPYRLSPRLSSEFSPGSSGLIPFSRRGHRQFTPPVAPCRPLRHILASRLPPPDRRRRSFERFTAGIVSG